MSTEEKELLLKDLCARLPYGVIVNYNGLTDYTLDVKLMTTHFIEKMKPYLRSINSITVNEKYDFNQLGSNSLSIQDLSINEVDWLNAHHFDYRGLIEKGLALKAPEGMYE